MWGGGDWAWCRAEAPCGVRGPGAGVGQAPAVGSVVPGGAVKSATSPPVSLLPVSLVGAPCVPAAG